MERPNIYTKTLTKKGNLIFLKVWNAQNISGEKNNEKVKCHAPRSPKVKVSRSKVVVDNLRKLIKDPQKHVYY